MGTVSSYILSSEFYIYSRNLSDDKYTLLYELEEGNPMSRFKHEIFAFALRKKHANMKSLYLYCGYTRIAKCIKSVVDEIPYMTIDFVAKEHAEAWDACREQIPPIYKDLTWLETNFGKKWVFQVTDEVCVRKYQNYRMV